MPLSDLDKQWICKVLGICIRSIAKILIVEDKATTAHESADRIERLYMFQTVNDFDSFGRSIKPKDRFDPR